MKTKLVLLFLISLPLSVSAQKNEIDALRVGMFTEKMSLSEEQAVKFWPLYNSYASERRKIFMEIRKEKRESNASNLSEDERLASQEEILELRKAEIGLVEDYRTKFLKIISAKQYSQMLLAEEEFNKMLLQELKRRRGN